MGRTPHLTKMTETNPEAINRRGCYIFLVALVLVAVVVAWLAAQPADQQQANETISEPSLRS